MPSTNNPVRDFLMTPTGGWAVVNGDFGFASGQVAVEQGCRIRGQTLLTEVWVDESLGVDYLGKILVRNADPLEVRAEFSAQFSAVPDVTDVVGAQLVGPDETRAASISYQVASIYSSSPIASEFDTP